MNAPLNLTIAIPVKNEAQSLAGCLTAIGNDLATAIIIIDSGSTDNTKAIAAAFGTMIIDFNWNGQYPKKRNWYLNIHCPKTKWVLFLDADEYLTEGFKQEMRTVLNKDDKAGYWLNYTVYFMGKRLRGGYPFKKLALFKTGFGEYEKIEEDRWSSLDMEVHEHPVIIGDIGIIRSKIEHRDYRGISHYIRKHNEYADWEAERFLKSFNDEEAAKSWTWKQRLKYKLMQRVFIGPAYFIGSFFIMGGFRDGSRGLAFALLKSSYFTQVYCKIREKRTQKERNQYEHMDVAK